uniref:Uncharacterized protein n=1 Tax=Fagus sylvatica TaxID=28930 RepID=A0A2N9FM61_FAGSY
MGFAGWVFWVLPLGFRCTVWWWLTAWAWAWVHRVVVGFSGFCAWVSVHDVVVVGLGLGFTAWWLETGLGFWWWSRGSRPGGGGAVPDLVDSRWWSVGFGCSGLIYGGGGGGGGGGWKDLVMAVGYFGLRELLEDCIVLCDTYQESIIAKKAGAKATLYRERDKLPFARTGRSLPQFGSLVKKLRGFFVTQAFSPDRKIADVYSEGAGFINFPEALDPGLVNACDDKEFVNFLVGQGYKKKSLRKIFEWNGDKTKAIKASELNYPWYCNTQ